MATYYQTPDGYIAVTGETPRGPLRGIVFVGRGPKPGGGPETVHEQAFARAQFEKLVPVDPGQIPDAWLEALGYDWPRPALEIGVNFLPGLFEPKPVSNAKWRLWPVALGFTLYVVSVLVFWWLKHHGLDRRRARLSHLRRPHEVARSDRPRAGCQRPRSEMVRGVAARPHLEWRFPDVMLHEELPLEDVARDAAENYLPGFQKKHPDMLDFTAVAEFLRHETWCIVWFNHYTFDRGQSNAEVLASFEQFVKRMRHVEGYCLMGAEDHWRWRGENRGPAPCRCEHCRKEGVIRIDH